MIVEDPVVDVGAGFPTRLLVEYFTPTMNDWPGVAPALTGMISWLLPLMNGVPSKLLFVQSELYRTTWLVETLCTLNSRSPLAELLN